MNRPAAGAEAAPQARRPAADPPPETGGAAARRDWDDLMRDAAALISEEGRLPVPVPDRAVTATTASSPLRGVALGGIANLAGSAVSGGAGLLITWLVAATLGPGGAGLFFAATSAFLIATGLARLGTPTGLVYWIARLSAHGAPRPLAGPLRVGLVPVAVLGTVLGIAGYAAAPALAAAFQSDPAQAAEYARLLRILAVFVPAATILDATLAATRGLSTMAPTVHIERLGRTLAQLALLALAMVAAEPGGDGAAVLVTAAWAVPYLPAVLLAARWLRRRARRDAAADAGGADGAEPAENTVTPAAFWRYTAPRALGSVAQLALQRLDILLVAGMLGFTEAAVYTVATRFLIAGQLANLAVGSSVQPRIAAALATRDLATARRLYRHTTTWIVVVAWPIYLSAVVLAHEYLGLFGSEYATGPAVAVVAVLAGAMLVASGCGTVDTVLSMSGRTTWQLANVLAALAVNVSVDLWLIPVLGIVGAAIGWAAAVLTNNLVPLTQLALAERLHPFGRESWTAMAAAVICFAMLPLTAAVLFGTGARLPAAVAGALLYAGVLWVRRGPLLTRHLT